MNYAIRALWGCAAVTVVAAGIEFYDARLMSGAVVLAVAAGLGALAAFLTQRYA